MNRTFCCVICEKTETLNIPSKRSIEEVFKEQGWMTKASNYVMQPNRHRCPECSVIAERKKK